MPTSSMSLSKRITKYLFHYILVIPALFLIFINRILPLLTDLFISLTDYNIFSGMFGSQWVGLDNYRNLFALPELGQVFRNTVAIKLGSIGLTGVVAFGLALALGAIRPGWLRRGFSALFLLPFFIPSLVIAYLALIIFSMQTAALFPVNRLYLGEEGTIRPILMLLELLKTVGIPVALALAAMDARAGSAGTGYWHRFGAPAGMAVLSFMILQMTTLLSVDFESTHFLVSPLTYEVANTLDAYAFRLGLQQIQFSLVSALAIVQFVLQLALIVLAYLLLRSLSQKTLFAVKASSASTADRSVKLDKADTTAGTTTRSFGGTALGIIAASAYALFAAIPLYFLFVSPFLDGSGSDLRLSDFLSTGNYALYLIAFAALSVFGAIWTATLAFPMTAKDLPGRTVYRLFLLIAVASGQGLIGKYMIVHNLSMTNTIFSQFLFGLVTVAGAFVVKSIFNHRHADLRAQAEASGMNELNIFFGVFLPNVWKPLVGLTVLNFVGLWNSFYNSLIYFNSPEHFTPIARLLTLLQSAMTADVGLDDRTILLCAAVISVPPIALFLIFRKWITPETFLGQIRK